jgi:hypothetical protein
MSHSRQIILSLALIYAISLHSSCSRDNEAELFADQECNLDNVKYSTVIAPIMQIHCNDCHNRTAPQANVITEDHASLHVIVLSGQLLGAIKHQPGFAAMPFGLPKLDDCIIQKIEAWVKAGAPND